MPLRDTTSATAVITNYGTKIPVLSGTYIEEI